MRFRLQHPQLSSDERVRSYVLLGALLGDELGDLQGGIDNYRAALTFAPSGPASAEIRYALALLLISARDYPAARKELEGVLLSRPDHPAAFSIRATLEDLQGKPKEEPPKSSLPRESLLPRLAPAVQMERAPVVKEADEKKPQPMIRVLVARDYSVTVTSQGAIFAYGADAQKMGAGSRALQCRAELKSVLCGTISAAIVQLIPSRGNLLSVGDRSYRGAIVLRVEDGKLIAVNRLAIEQYLYGVLPREVPHDWPLEALKAQAVAARTYAYSQIARASGQPYDVEDTVMSQVYGGASAEQPQTTRAVDETRSEVARHHGQIIVAYFHSHSGGRTEDPAFVWGARLPYLKSRDDPYSMASGPMAWTAAFAMSEIHGKLAPLFPHVGKVTDLQVVRKNGSRAEWIRVVGTKRSAELSANRLRLALGPAKLKSTAFQMKRSGKSIRFQGRGYGHGVGMSQWGAMAMAQKGIGYRDILSFYYQGVSIDRVESLN
jgi:stage II sporulation protein D